MENRPPKLIYAGIAAAAGAVLLLEIGLTRIFSYTIWYHFAYLTISVALLGFGASGSVLAAFPSLRERRGLLSGWALAAQLGVLVCLVVVDRVRLDPLAIGTDPFQLARLAVYYLAVALPFFAGGFLVAAPLGAFPTHVSRLYFWDLVGAGAACGLVVPLIWWLGTPVATALSTVAFAFAAWAYAEPGLRMRRALAAVVLSAITIGYASGGSFNAAPTKFVSQWLDDPRAELAYSSWSPISRVDVVTFDPPLETGSYIEWGISLLYEGTAPGFYMIGNDGDSCAVMYGWDGELASIDFLNHHVLRVPYLLLDRPDVLAIGLGGGADVLNGLNNDANSIVGVEINPMTVYVGRELYREFNGDLLNHPRVEAVAAEGRSFLRSRDASYDLIEINSVDTLSALSTGAYVLSESFLYTSDAVQDYLDHLNPGGVFAMAVGDLNITPAQAPTPVQLPRHTLRLASVVRHALEERGVPEPARHVMVVGSIGWRPLTHTLVKNEPFTAEEIARVEAFVEAEAFQFWHRPDRDLGTLTTKLLTWEPPVLESFLANHRLKLGATTDDSPFFFNFFKWRSLLDSSTYAMLGYDRTQATGQLVLVIMLAQSLLFGAALIFVPLRRVPLPAVAVRPGRAALLVYFAALGTGFILLEISFIQRFVLFLGYPTYSLTVVLLSLLVSTGIGSLLTERIDSRFAEALPPRLAALLLLAGGYLVVTPIIFDALLGAALAVRVAVSIALLVPLGLVLGAFFPLGVRIAERVEPRLVPWAWAVNGCATVVGTLLAVMAGMTWSFTWVAVLALSIYAIGVGTLALAARTRWTLSAT